MMTAATVELSLVPADEDGIDCGCDMGNREICGEQAAYTIECRLADGSTSGVGFERCSEHLDGALCEAREWLLEAGRG